MKNTYGHKVKALKIPSTNTHVALLEITVDDCICVISHATRAAHVLAWKGRMLDEASRVILVPGSKLATVGKRFIPHFSSNMLHSLSIEEILQFHDTLKKGNFSQQ